MEQVPHWLMATVFAAGMTAYAEEVDVHSAHGIAAEAQPVAAASEGPDSYH